MSDPIPEEQPAREEHPQLASLDPATLVQEGKQIRSGDGNSPENTAAFHLFRLAALAGHAEAQYLVSDCYRHGCGVEPDEASTLAWLLKSAESGFVKACVHLAVHHQRAAAKDEDEAIKWFQKAAEAGCAGACSTLAGLYKARGDLAGCLRWDKEYALLGNPEALWDVRTFYEHREGVEVDLPEAWAWLALFEDTYTTWKNSEELVCFQLDPESSKYKTVSQHLNPLMSASQLYQGNRRYLELVKKRVEWIRKKATDESRIDQYNLGWCYREGYGVVVDLAESMHWWRMAAEQGERRAQNNLGYCYKYAQGVEVNHLEAVRWFRKSAEQGHAAAQYSLGHSYCTGLGIPEDYVEGVKWIRKSAEGGNTCAQHNMGFLYCNGWGVPQDKEKALAWYRYAASRGYANSQQEADTLAASMPPEKLESASRLYRQFKTKHFAQ